MNETRNLSSKLCLVLEVLADVKYCLDKVGKNAEDVRGKIKNL